MSKPEKKKKNSKKSRYIDPPNILRQKVGYGGIKPEILEDAESFISENNLEFVPYAEAMIGRLDEVITAIHKGDLSGEDAVNALIRPIMELKASGGMFRYILVSEIAGVVLNFLETVRCVDSQAMEIVGAHQNALKLIVANRLEGNGGKEGQALAQELHKACERYYRKKGV